jgi:hypothetical protein
MRHLAPAAAALLGCLGCVPAASAQTGTPTIQSVLTGCFYRLSRANNVLVTLGGPLTANYRYTFISTATQQTVLDQAFPSVHAGEEVPFQLPAAGSYRVAVRFAMQGPGAVPATSQPFIVAAVVVASVNGHPECRERAVGTSPGPQR